MVTRRRWIQFSLRGLLGLLTALGLCFGVAVNRGREQAEAVKRIEAVWGVVDYDWEPPIWLRRYRRNITFDCFRKVERVQFCFRTPEYRIVQTIPYLQRLKTLNAVAVGKWVSNYTRDELKAALPDCEVRLCNELRLSRPDSATTGRGQR